jgi:putative glutamine amidotransferase
MPKLDYVSAFRKRLNLFICASVVLILVIISLTLLNSVQAKHANNKPLIGILLNTGTEGGYSDYPWYAIRQNYSQVVSHYGGVPVFIGHDAKNIDDYIDVLDGIVLTGGDMNSPEGAYTTGIGVIDQRYHSREYLEFALIKKAYEKDIPVLGICAGMQHMNMAFGGTLYENLKKEIGTPIQHRNEQRDKLIHPITIKKDSKLFKILKTTSLKVNSNHNAGLNKIGANFKVTALAPDGVVEGIEMPDKRFFIGVIWHPEFHLTEQEGMLWQAFIHSAGQYKLATK